MTNKLLFQKVVGTGTGTLAYSVPVGYKATLKNMVMVNTTGSSVLFTFHLVQSGDTVTSSNIMFRAAIPSNTTVDWSGSQEMDGGDFIQLISAIAGVTVTMSGEERRNGT